MGNILFKLDLRTKILLIPLVNVMYFLGGNYIYVTLACILAIFLIGLSRRVRSAIKASIFLMIIESIRFYIPTLPIHIQSVVLNAFFSVLMFYPMFLFGMLFISTLNISEVIAAFSKWRVPQSVMIPIIVMIRFFPTLFSELRNIRASMLLRGRSSNILTKVLNIYVPILFSSVRTGEALTIAAMTKGMGLNRTSTILKDPKFGFFDFLIVGIMIVLIAARLIST